MALFISYSSQDRSAVDALTTALRRGQQQVWFDQELGGGDSWWHQILEQIRTCEVFVVALSNNWLQSKPSQSELRYAQALNRPILPVRIGDVDSMRVNPLAALQIIDYREPTVDAGIQLVTAVHKLTAKPQPLPDPLPQEPPVPFGYITRLGNTLAEKELSPQQQLQALVELRSGFDEDGDDPSARGDIAQLLRMLRLRHDVTYRTRSEIDNVLAEIQARDKAAAAKAQGSAPTTPTQPSTRPRPAPGAPQPAKPGAADGAATSNRRVLVIGGAALAVVVAIVVAVVLFTQTSGKKQSAVSGRTTAPGTGGQAAPAPETPGQPAPAAPSPLDAVLLPALQISTKLGSPATMDIANSTTQPRTDVNLSNPACAGAFDAIQNSAYAGSGFTGVRGQDLSAPGDSTYRVYQAAVSFPNADNAQSFVAGQADKWRACNGAEVVLTTPNGSAHWTFGNLLGGPPKITTVRKRKDGSTCEHVLSAVSNVVLDVRACAANISDQAGQIADAMAANVK